MEKKDTDMYGDGSELMVSAYPGGKSSGRV